MKSYRGAWLTLVGALGLSLCAPAQGEKAEDGKPSSENAKSQYVRLVRNGDVPAAMETAIVRFTSADGKRPGLEVDLVAAVHVAEKSYYAELNRRFSQYDVVLYELVAPEGTRVPKGGGQTSNNPVSMLQNVMTNVLELEFQLKGIDYTAENFVHADLSPEQLARSMDRRGENVWTIMLRMMGYAMAQQGGSAGNSDAQLLMALFDKNRSLALKRVMAEQFEDLDGALDAIGGPDGSALISDRNQAALDVLRQQIDAGKRRIAIFYGGGHMPDFEQRLRNDFGLVPADTQWLVAWDMKK